MEMTPVSYFGNVYDYKFCQSYMVYLSSTVTDLK
jgi:hypothetical protein